MKGTVLIAEIAPSTTPLWALGLYLAFVVATAVGQIGLSYILGERHRKERATGIPYESGMVSTGGARLRFSAEFYLVAMLFVIFDLESVFLFAWAVTMREAGWFGYAEAVIFIGILVAALLYLWRVGALDLDVIGVRKQARAMREPGDMRAPVR